MLPFRGKSDLDTRVLTGNEVFEFCQENNLLFLPMLDEGKGEIKTKNNYPVILSSVVDGKEHHALFHMDSQSKVDFIERGFTPSVLQSPAFWEKLCECEKQCSDIFYSDSEKSLIAMSNNYNSYYSNFPCDPVVLKRFYFTIFGFGFSLLIPLWITNNGIPQDLIIDTSFFMLFMLVMFCLLQYFYLEEKGEYKKAIGSATLKYLSDPRNISIPQKSFLEERLSYDKDLEKIFSEKRKHFVLSNDFLMYLSGFSSIEAKQTDVSPMDVSVLEKIISDIKELHGEEFKIIHHLECIHTICSQIISMPNSKVESFLSEVFQKAIPIWKDYANLSSLSKNDETEAHVLDFTESILGHLSSIHQEMIYASYGNLDEKIVDAKTEITVKFLEAKKDVSHQHLLPEPKLDSSPSSSSSMPFEMTLDSISNTKKKSMVYG